ncbi:hypothetical protein C7999DRAFT_36420 [Corynascus novoguineensis]|uniref:Uncharacterized protein n=1 Tax=Corynascus novoguineensis TaxID=1126955 RepID=A0AAN7CJK9_9PEZI|nr:hypothetical protein C7999DRAFT_36420 [Corynascus novoguineensis]
MAPNSSPGSSPPEVAGLRSYWQDIQPLGDRGRTTWTQKAVVPWRVDWQEALGYARRFYNHVSVFPNASTDSTGTCLAAVLVALFQEPNEDGNLSHTKSVITICTIPRGDRNDRITGWYGRLWGPNGGHPEWRDKCYHWGLDDKGPEMNFASDLHAEDLAINLMLGFKAVAAEVGQPVHWLDDMSMVIYGKFGSNQPGQVIPCRGGRRKRPSCQNVLDRMGIQWRFGTIPPRPPTPEPQLPRYPDNWRGGNGGSGGSDGGGSNRGHNASSISTPIYDSWLEFFSQFDYDGRSSSSQRSKSSSHPVTKTGKTPVRSSPSKNSVSLSSSLAKMSLSGGTAQQRSISSSAVDPRANGATAGKTIKERVANPAAAGTGSQGGAVGAAKITNTTHPGPCGKVATGITEKPQATESIPVSQAPHAVKTVKKSLAPPALASSYVRRVARDDRKLAGSETSPGPAPRCSGSNVVGQQQKQVSGKKATAR